MSADRFLKTLLLIAVMLVFFGSCIGSLVSGRGLTSPRAESVLVPPLR